ncbi:MAG TPA: pyridoxine 5'-phosphate synthase [Candidatus Acidoferrum sp.]|nr:pyridoxine 5'-phosphate synthase [Candidatus Acidoferrum sp.]
MTALSVNVNKLALLRNSRGRNFPDLALFGERLLAMGAHGLTVHPRPDERHVKFADLPVLSKLVARFPGREFNIEGFPSADFVQRVIAVKPQQCTLVPDAANQLTSDHGWDLKQQGNELRSVIAQLQQRGIRVSLFLDPDPAQAALAKSFGTDRIELYTEGYAHAFGTADQTRVLDQYRAAAERAQQDGIGVNAGHDLDLRNLPAFLAIPGILEVSIGHALTIECIEQGMAPVIAQYLQICGGGH